MAALIRQTSSILSWLHQNLSNELSILDCSALDRFKYIEVVNTIFGDRLPQRIAYRVQAQIDQILELKSTSTSSFFKQQSEENLYIYQFQMWNILVQYHMIFREHIFKKFQLYGNYKDEYISPEQEFLKLAVLKDFMEVSRVKQLQQLSESLVKITLPKLNQGNSGGQHDFDCEKMMLIILDMLKQFLFYYVTS